MKNRVEWIDIAKGIGMVLVEMGHTYFPRSICLWILSFHMPLFFLLSGMTYSGDRYNLKEFVLRKFKTIMIPYFIFNIVSVAISLVLSMISLETIDGFGTIKSILFNWGDRPVWFLMCLFLTECLYFVIDNFFIKNMKYRKFVVMLILFIIAWLNNAMKFAVMLPFCLDIIPTSMLFIMLGSYINEAQWGRLCDKRIMPVMFFGNLITVVISTHFFDMTIFMVTNEYGNYPLAIIGALLGSCFVFSVSKFMEKTNTVLKKIVMFIGRNSIVFYGFHTLVNPWVDRVLCRILPYYNINSVNKILTSVILLFATFGLIGFIVVPLYNNLIKKIINK